MEDEEDTYVPKIAWGDLSAIAVAACFSLLCLGLIVYMLLGGRPMASVIDRLNDTSATAPQEPTQADVPMNLAPGEVSVAVPPKAKKPPPKP
jgi:hypothetical protein